MAESFQKTIPILRIFDVEKAKEFYVIDPFGNRIRFNEDVKEDKATPTSKRCRIRSNAPLRCPLQGTSPAGQKWHRV
jgi:hypothetical protein